MKPGNLIKNILAPFVKNTRYENCEECNKRRVKVNNFWTRTVNKVKAWLNK